MSVGFLKRSGLQLFVSGGQIIILMLFIVVFPKLADEPATWAASYFLALAVATPIFMFFGFELRKRSAAHEGESLMDLNKQRFFATGLAVLASWIVYGALALTGIELDAMVFAVLVVFKVGQAINDQITANYEWRDVFGISAISASLRVCAFVPVALVAAVLGGPNLAIVLGTLAFGIVWLGFDIRKGISLPDWVGISHINSTAAFAGVGSFAVSLSVNAPRIIAAYLFGEAALIIMGVGQSLNRVGQIVSSSLVQTYLAMRRRNAGKAAVNQRIIVGIQIAVLVVFLALIPLWHIVFDYASQAPAFTYAMIALLVFGFASQFNYLVQSVLLVVKSSKDFAASPVYFLVLLAIGTLCLWALDLLAFMPFLILMILCRIGQAALNLLNMRRA